MADALERKGIVGRDRELAIFRRTLDRARRGRGDVMLLEAPAGQGKTTLAEAFAHEAAAGCVPTFWGRCWEAGGAPPFWPWIHILREVLDSEAGASALKALNEASRQVLELVGDAGADPSGQKSDNARFAMFDAVARLFQRLTKDAPVLVILDDLHASDVASLRLLQFLAREVRGTSLLLVGTYRPADARSVAEVLDLLGDIAREGEVMPLRGLQPAELAVALEDVIDFPMSNELSNLVYEATEGNPYFAREIVRMLDVEGRVVDAEPHLELSLPPRVSQAVLRRLEPLDRRVRGVIDAAAVIGRDFEADMVAAITGCSVGGVIIALSAAATEDVVRPAAGGYSFTHVVTRDAIYEALDPLRRAELHTLVADVLEARGGHGAEVAHHLRRGVPVAGAARAFEATVTAIDQALSVYGFEEVVALSGVALELADAAGADPRRRAAVMIRRGRAEARLGLLDQAHSTFLRAAQTSRESGDDEGVARAALAYAELPMVGGLTDTQLVQLLEDAARRLPADDTELRALVLARLAHSQIFTPDLEGRVALVSSALAIARKVASPRALAAVLEATLAVLVAAKLDEEALALADEAVDLARSLGDRELEVISRARRANWLLDLRPIREFHEEVAAVQGLADVVRHPIGQWMAVQLALTQAMIAGEIDRFDELSRIGSTLPDPNAAGARAAQEGTLRLLRGEGGEEFIEGARFIAAIRPGIALAWEAVACAYEVTTGRRDDAAMSLRRLVDAAETHPRDQRFPVALAFLTDAAAALHDAESAARLHMLLAELAGHHVFISMVTPVLYLGPVELYLGITARVGTRPDEAADYLRSAVAIAGRTGARIAITRARVELARTLLDQGDRTEAHHLAEKALSYAEGAGLRTIADAALEVLATGDGVAARAGAGSRPGLDDCPAFIREGEYWSLTYDGEVLRLRDTKAARHLAILLEHPNREFPVLDLVAAVEGHEPRKRPAAEQGWEALDAQAKNQYRMRLEELAGELDDAEAVGNDLRAERTRSEMDFIAHELSAAMGLGGRDRSGGATEQARVAVTKLLKRIIQRIGDGSPQAGLHLRATIKTGAFCGYLSDTQPTRRWRVDTG